MQDSNEIQILGSETFDILQNFWVEELSNSSGQRNMEEKKSCATLFPGKTLQ